MMATTTASGLAAVVLGYYERIDRGDVDGALSCFGAAAVYHRPGYPPLHGSDEIRDYYESTRIIASGTHVVHDVVYNDSMVAVRGSFTGRSRDGEPLSVGFSDFWEFDGGRVANRRTFFDAPAV